MHFHEEITSVQNPKVKQVVRWRDRPDRDDSQVVLAEGYRALVRALAGGYRMDEVFVCPEFFPGQEHEAALLEQLRAQGAKLIRVAPAAFAKMAYRDRPEGLLGVGPQRHRTLADLQLSPCPFLLVAEGVEKRFAAVGTDQIEAVQVLYQDRIRIVPEKDVGDVIAPVGFGDVRESDRTVLGIPDSDIAAHIAHGEETRTVR